MAEEGPDYYGVLDLTKTASDSEVKRAYRKLAMKYHPDKNPDNAEAASTFQLIAEAYDVLIDKEKRAIYDQYGYEGLRDGLVDGYGQTRGGYGKPDAQEIFESFFGTANPFADFGFGQNNAFGSKLKRPGPKKAPDVVTDLVLTLEELYTGCVKRLCVTRKKYNPEGNLEDSDKVLTINIGAGWKKGTKITFPCEGDEGPGIIPADLVFKIVEKKHPVFSRDGSTLIYNCKISLSDALTDFSIKVPALDGRILSFPCPEVVAPEYKKCIPKEGMPHAKDPNTKGDLIIQFETIFPKYICNEKKDKIRALLANPAH